jgi:hypothetical protein
MIKITHELPPIPAPVKVMGDFRKDCCRDAVNLVYHDVKMGDTVCYRCKQCGCRHFEITADPGRLGIRGF